MEVLCSSKTSVNVYHLIQRKITEYLSLYHHCYDKHKFHTIYRYIWRSHSVVSKDSGQADLLFPEDGDPMFFFFFLMSGTDHPATQKSYCRRPESSDLQSDVTQQTFQYSSCGHSASNCCSYSSIGKSLSLTSWPASCRPIPYLMWTTFRCFPGLLFLKIPA